MLRLQLRHLLQLEQYLPTQNLSLSVSPAQKANLTQDQLQLVAGLRAQVCGLMLRVRRYDSVCRLILEYAPAKLIESETG